VKLVHEVKQEVCFRDKARYSLLKERFDFQRRSGRRTSKRDNIRGTSVIVCVKKDGWVDSRAIAVQFARVTCLWQRIKDTVFPVCWHLLRFTLDFSLLYLLQPSVAKLVVHL